MTRLKKGEHIRLNVTQKATHRVMVGLGWDPNEGQNFLTNVTDILKGKKLHHDLDLSCYIYDKNLNLLDKVSAVGGSSDKTGYIYHSGDNIEGHGDGDDEEISAELKNLPNDIQHLVFTSEIKTGQNFKDVLNPEMRIVDGYSDHEFLKISLEKRDGSNSSSYLFVHIYRDENDWNLHFVDNFINKDLPCLEKAIEQAIS